MAFVNIKSSGIVGSIGSIVGKMQGELTTKISNSVLELEDKFSDGSPSPRELERIKNTRNNLIKRTQNVEKRLAKLEKVPKTISAVIPKLKVVLAILMALPIPTSVPPGIGVPISLTNKYADLMHKLKELIKQAEQDVDGLDAVMNVEGGISKLAGSLKDRLLKLDKLFQFALIENAIKQLPLPEQKDKGFIDDDGIYISSTLMPMLIGGDTAGVNKLLENLDVDFTLGEKLDVDGFGREGKYYHRSPRGDLYELAIIEDQKSPAFAKQRYAVAKNTQGVVMLKGQSSFSADTDILLEEIKFRIDNQLP